MAENHQMIDSLLSTSLFQEEVKDAPLASKREKLSTLPPKTEVEYKLGLWF
jgi:hypothetical protein